MQSVHPAREKNKEAPQGEAGESAAREEEETNGRVWEGMSDLESYPSRKTVSPEIHKSHSFKSIL